MVCVDIVMNPVLKRRLVDSIEYLRKLDFFQDYSHLTSEEILEKIFNGEINYPHSWWYEEPRSSLEKPEPILHGLSLKRDLEEHQKYWIGASNFEIDREIVFFDTKRVMKEDIETDVDDNIGVAILKRLTMISRGIFQPTNISWRWLTPVESKWLVQEVSFDFKDKRQSIEIALQYDYIMDIGLKELNEIIKDSEYQYYQIEYEDIIVIALTKEEAERLKKERGWKFEARASGPSDW